MSAGTRKLKSTLQKVQCVIGVLIVNDGVRGLAATLVSNSSATVKSPLIQGASHKVIHSFHMQKVLLKMSWLRQLFVNWNVH